MAPPLMLDDDDDVVVEEVVEADAGVLEEDGGEAVVDAGVEGAAPVVAAVVEATWATPKAKPS
jgi:hypothetical protein